MKRALALLPMLILILLASPVSVQAGKGLRITSSTLKNPVTVDGKWTTVDEWRDGVGFDCGGYGWIALKDDTDSLYVLVDHTKDFDATAGDFAWIVWDQKNDGGSKPRSDDYNLLMRYETESSYELSVYQGTGTDWDWENPKVASSLGVVGASSTDATSDPRSKASHVTYEFRLPRLILDNSTVITSIGFYAGAQNAAGGVWIGLPRGGDYRIPDSWAQLTFSVPIPVHAYEGSQVVCPLLLKTVTIDGKWTVSDEWSDAVVVALVKSWGSSLDAIAYLYAKHDESNFYFLIDFVSATSLSASWDGAGITLDPLHNSGNKPQSDDRRFDSSYTGGSMAIGTGVTFDWRNVLPRGAETRMSMAGSSNLAQSHEVSEFKIPFAIFPELQDTVGFAAAAYAGGYEGSPDFKLATWPKDYYRDVPNTWGELTFSAKRTTETTATTGLTQTATTTTQQNYSTGTETFPVTITATTPVTRTGVVNALFGSLSGGDALLLVALAVLVPLTYMVGRRRRKLVSYLKRDRYVEYLARLEELRSRGDISEETYLRLKEEYWKKFGK